MLRWFSSMKWVVRPLTVFAVASGIGLAAALQLAVGGAPGEGGPTPATSFSARYELEELDLVQATLYHLDLSYVDPARLDWEAMYVGALDAVERRVPSVLFSREPGSGIVAVEVGEHRTVLEVPPIEGRRPLYDALHDIAVILDAELDDDDIPMDGVRPPDPAGAAAARPAMAEVEYALVNGLLSPLDPHSVLLPPDAAHEMDVENQGEFGGLGITITTDPNDGKLLVAEPSEGTPAFRAGLRPDDHIVRIDGESTINMNMSEAIVRLRGPVGAPLTLEIRRSGVVDPIEVRLVRELIDVHPVRRGLLDGGVGYIQIQGFNDKAEAGLLDALSWLRQQNGGELDGLVLDLRNNPGGFLQQAVKVADVFLASGDIVSTIDGEGRRTDPERATRMAEPTFPIAVLVDANSASASEIVAGALRYNERAIVIGERTFGKGSVQNLHGLADNSKLKLTISTYRAPGDRSIQAVGIPADIELVPSIVPPPGSDDPVRLYYRERARREADLDHSLQALAATADDPAWQVRYLEPPRDPRRRLSDGPDLADWQVELARDVLKAARWGWRRSDVLAAAEPVVARHQKLGAEAIDGAFRARGIDWTRGAPSPRIERDPLDGHRSANGLALSGVTVALDLGPDGVLTAGQAEDVALVVTNTSDRTLFQVGAVVTDGAAFVDREFFLGKIGPGESARSIQTVHLDDGWPSERVPVTVELRDSGPDAFAVWTGEVAVVGHDLPSLAWTWTATDAHTGDGDGVLDSAESVEIHVTMTNQGPGLTGDPFARLRNRAGRSIDILQGTLQPGTTVTATGEPCPMEPGDPLPASCRRLLAPGEEWQGTFALAVRPGASGPLEIDIELGDAEAYDHGAIVRAGFYRWFSQSDPVILQPGRELPTSALRRPPRIEVTRAPELHVTGAHATLSGVVTDDKGLRHVMVFVGDDKVFYESGATAATDLRSLPYTANVVLAPGANQITVLATDVDGFVASRSVTAWSESSELAAK